VAFAAGPRRVIPPAPFAKRQVCDSISTWQVPAYDRMVSATATARVRVLHPNEAPCFMSMVPEGTRTKGAPLTGWWLGSGQVQVWAANEILALQLLFTTLEGLSLEVPEVAREVCNELALMALSKLTHDTWPLHPMGIRAKCPKRERHQFRDANGKKWMIYKDTLRAHNDPACKCPGCTLLSPPPAENEDE
jgi:hypothetical protein